MREIIEKLKQKYSEGYRYWNQEDHYITEAEYVDLLLESAAVGYVDIRFAIEHFQRDVILQQM